MSDRVPHVDQWIHTACVKGRSGTAGYQTYAASDTITAAEDRELSTLAHVGACLMHCPDPQITTSFGLVPLSTGRWAMFNVRRDGFDDIGRPCSFIHALIFQGLADVPEHPVIYDGSPSFRPPLTAEEARRPAPPTLPALPVASLRPGTSESLESLSEQLRRQPPAAVLALVQSVLLSERHDAVLITGSPQEIRCAFAILWAFANTSERAHCGFITYQPESLPLPFRLVGSPLSLGRPSDAFLRHYAHLFHWQSPPRIEPSPLLANALTSVLASGRGLAALQHCRQHLGAATLCQMHGPELLVAQRHLNPPATRDAVDDFVPAPSPLQEAKESIVNTLQSALPLLGAVVIIVVLGFLVVTHQPRERPPETPVVVVPPVLVEEPPKQLPVVESPLPPPPPPPSASPPPAPAPAPEAAPSAELQELTRRLTTISDITAQPDVLATLRLARAVLHEWAAFKADPAPRRVAELSAVIADWNGPLQAKFIGLQARNQLLDALHLAEAYAALAPNDTTWSGYVKTLEPLREHLDAEAPK